jgi:hypothetical protein
MYFDCNKIVLDFWVAAQAVCTDFMVSLGFLTISNDLKGWKCQCLDQNSLH